MPLGRDAHTGLGRAYFTLAYTCPNKLGSVITIRATYPGDASHAGSASKTLTLRIKLGTTLTCTASPASVQPGQAHRITCTLKDQNGQPLPKRYLTTFQYIHYASVKDRVENGRVVHVVKNVDPWTTWMKTTGPTDGQGVYVTPSRVDRGGSYQGIYYHVTYAGDMTYWDSGGSVNVPMYIP